jgi:hypothetical protein
VRVGRSANPAHFPIETRAAKAAGVILISKRGPVPCRSIQPFWRMRSSTRSPTGGVVELTALMVPWLCQQEEVVPIAITVIIAMLLSVTVAGAAPRQLYGKGIEIQYTVTATSETARGPRSGTSNVSRTIYVSSTGRLFERAAWAVRGSTRVSDNAPGASTNKGGEVRDMSFRGNNLVAHIAYSSGAGQMTIHFDPTFSTCEGSVRFGSETGGAIRRQVHGEMRQFTSLQASTVSCRVMAGNPLQ